MAANVEQQQLQRLDEILKLMKAAAGVSPAEVKKQEEIKMKAAQDLSSAAKSQKEIANQNNAKRSKQR